MATVGENLMLGYSNVELSPATTKNAPRLRPMSVFDDGSEIVVDRLHSHGWKNKPGLHITPSWEHYDNAIKNNRMIHCPLVTVKNTLIGNITSTDGSHIDAGFFDGGKLAPTDFVMRDVTAYSIQKGHQTLLWTGGWWGMILVERVRVFGDGNSPMFDSRSGPIGTIVIRDSPGFVATLQGPPGSIGTVFVDRDIEVKESRLPGIGAPGAKIVRI